MKKIKRIYLQMPFLYQKEMVNSLENLCVLAPQINRRNISFYKEYATSHNLLIDNAIFEKKEISIKNYLTLIKKIKPTFAILPDKYSEYRATFELHKIFLSEIRENSIPIAVLQPLDNKKSISFLQVIQFCEWCIAENIKYVAIPYIHVSENKKSFIHTDREEIIKLILKEFPTLNIHLLGIEHFSDFHLLQYKNVASVDTTFFYTNALFKKRYEFIFYKAKSGLNWNKRKVNKNVLINLKNDIWSFKNENSFFGGLTF